MSEKLYPTGQDIVDYIVRNDLLLKRCDSVANGDTEFLTFAGPERETEDVDEYGESVMEYTDFILDLKTGELRSYTWRG